MGTSYKPFIDKAYQDVKNGKAVIRFINDPENDVNLMEWYEGYGANIETYLHKEFVYLQELGLKFNRSTGEMYF